MVAKYGKHAGTKETPQTEQHPGTEKNNAGGYSFAVDKWMQLQRFLILGAEGGTYYATEQKLTKDSAKALAACIQEDGMRALRIITEVSESGRAPKNDPALFALAMVTATGTEAVRKAAFAALPKVARIGTHLFHFAEYRQAFAGWGRGMRNAVGRWYTEREPAALALQLAKYQSRDGWSHRDLLRLSHPYSEAHGGLFEWAVKGLLPERLSLPPLIQVMEKLKDKIQVKEAAKLIAEHNVPRECVPTELLKHPEIWGALLPHMGLTAMIRNLGTMSKIGFLKPLSQASKTVVAALGDAAKLKKARIHPLHALTAQLTYASGHGRRSEATWSPVGQVIDALEEAFYATFGLLEPTGKNIMLALDVSGSMSGGSVGGVAGLTPRMASSAMAMVTARCEKDYVVMGFGTKFVPLNITPKMRLDTICEQTDGLPFSGTDCSQPMLYALDKKLEIDAFVVYTDSETYAGRMQPVQALQKYRRETGKKATLTVVGLTSDRFTIADPGDAGMMDVVGFDSAAPTLIQDFVRGGE